MQASVYEIEAAVEQTHWWFVGRRLLLKRELRRLQTPKDARVLDVGTSTGTNLRLLSELGYDRVRGVDMAGDAIRYCVSKNLGHVDQADVCALPFADGTFDVVLATDIIEHVEDDAAALREIARVLAPAGCAIVMVPCFRLMWGLQDEVSQHKRRYLLPQLRARLDAAGFRVTRAYYFNYLLFLPILVARRLISLSRVKLSSENELNTPLMNIVLASVFRFDIGTAPWLRPPFGVSAFAIAVKR